MVHCDNYKEGRPCRPFWHLQERDHRCAWCVAHNPFFVDREAVMAAAKLDEWKREDRAKEASAKEGKGDGSKGDERKGDESK